MTKKVVGVFISREQAEKAASQLRQAGFDKEISILTKGEGQGNRGHTEMRTDSVTNGATSGATWGALGGLALGAGALAIPGFGPLLAAGPIAAALSGAAAGGLGGALVDWGIPETESKQYESDVKQGKVLIAVECSENESGNAKQILERNGAEGVKEH